MSSKDFFVHDTAVIDDESGISAGCKIWHFCHLMPGVKLGEGCSLGQNVFIASDVIMGKNVKVQNNVSVYSGVVCEDDVFLGPSMVFTNVTNPRSAVVRKNKYEETLVKRGSTIGANATIICGNTIGKFSFIGAGSVVTKDVPDYALVIGNPAKQAGWMSEFGHRLEFENGVATCPESGEKYELKNNIVKKLNT